MTRYISILRGINVGGKRIISMSDLKQLYAGAGFCNLKTYIQSGNILFDSPSDATDLELATQIEKLIFEAYQFEVPVIIRTITALQEALSENPFYQPQETNIEQLHLTFLKHYPTPEALITMENIDFAPDRFKISGNNVYVYCLNNYSDSKLSNQFFEKKLKVPATTRNWKTVVKLLELGTC